MIEPHIFRRVRHSRSARTELTDETAEAVGGRSER